jgi:hypothetical protein
LRAVVVVFEPLLEALLAIVVKASWREFAIPTREHLIASHAQFKELFVEIHVQG